MKKICKICFVIALAVCIFNFSNIAVSAKTQTISNSKKISVNFKDSDIRDVLSVIALNMNYSVVYAGEGSRITIEMKDVTAQDAFDYVLKFAGLSYVKEGNSLIVAPKGVLVEDFSKSLSITSFGLKYISATVLTEKIQQINIPVTVLTMPSNDKNLWVQGLPGDISKVSELIRILDIQDNYTTDSNISADRKLLQTITTEHITATQFNEFISGLGFDSGVAFSANGRTLWIYATLEENEEIWELKKLVDRNDGFISAESTKSYNNIYVRYAKKDEVINAIKTAYPEIEIYSITSATRNFMILGKQTDVEGAKILAEKIDSINVASLEDTFITYPLQNISAAEAQRRLEKISFADNVQWHISNDGELSSTIFIYCNADYVEEVKQLLLKIDESAAADINKVNMPIFRGGSEAELAGIKAYIEVMLPNSIVGTFSTVNFDNEFVLYLQGTTTQTVKLIEELLAKTRNTDKTGGNVDVSWTAYLAENPAADPNDLAAYGIWVRMKLGN